MTAVTYTAKRSLIAGHTINTVYSLNLTVEQDGMTERKRTLRKVVKPLLEKGAEIIRFGNIRTFDVSLAPLTGAALLAVLEFLDSAEDTVFDFDPYGTVAVPVAPFQALRTNDDYTLQRSTALGQGGANDYFKISFSVTEA